MKFKILASLVAASLLALHILFPEVKLDGVSAVLILCIAVPWLGNIIKTMEFPSGFKIELRDIKSATDQVIGGEENRDQLENPILDSKYQDSINRVIELSNIDPNITLVTIRIELERILQDLAQQYGIASSRKPLKVLFKELQRTISFPESVYSGIDKLIMYGNKAAHGAEVSNEASELAISSFPQLISTFHDLGKVSEDFQNFIKSPTKG